MDSFCQAQEATMKLYLQQSTTPTPITQDFLYILNGWHYGKWGNASDRSKFFLPEDYRQTTGGYFLRWGKKGIAINPGENFLHNLHDQGLNVRDIDYVIVTNNQSSAHAEVRAIYDLNYQFNLKTEELHIIEYYLNQGTHRDLTAVLKPHFKQERNTVHCLELYVDSPDMESLDLSPGISLNYFPTHAPDSRGSTDGGSRPCLGIQLRLERVENSAVTLGDAVTVGYVTGTPWSPALAHSLAGTDILLAGFQNTGPDDYNRISYNRDCLGYFGCYSLIEQVGPKLLLCCEFGGREGDIRVELVKKMRQEYAFGSNQQTVILPGDTGLCIDLQQGQVCCSVSQQLIDPNQVKVVKSSEAFGALEYLAPSCVI
jgi:hypothetical protein